MAKLGIEKVAGVVALTYLVLIPIAGIYFFKRVQVMDQDLLLLLEKNGIKPEEFTLFGNVRKFVRTLPPTEVDSGV